MLDLMEMYTDQEIPCSIPGFAVEFFHSLELFHGI